MRFLMSRRRPSLLTATYLASVSVLIAPSNHIAFISAASRSSLVNAVVVNALQLCNAILGAQQRQQQQDPGPPLTQVRSRVPQSTQPCP